MTELQNTSKVQELLAYTIGEENPKGISWIDGFFTILSTAGLLLLRAYPKYAIPVFLLGAGPMTYRRGPLAAFVAPLAVATAVKNPALGAAAIREVIQVSGEAAKGVLDLGFKVSGLLVTSAGVIVGLILTDNKNNV